MASFSYRSNSRKQQTPENIRKSGAFAALMGLFAFGWAGFTVSSWHISESERTVEATVVDRVRRSDNWRPVYEFVNPATGQTERITGNSSGAGVADRIGEEAQVVIDADGDVSVRGTLTTAVFISAFGFLFAGVGGYLYFIEAERGTKKQLMDDYPQDKIREPTPQDAPPPPTGFSTH